MKAFTVLELMIAVALSGIIVFALYEVLSTQNRVYSVQSDVADMQQNVRTGIEKLSRDLALAGFGRPWWDDVNGIDGLDFSLKITNGNKLEIVGCVDAEAATLASGASTGATTLTIPCTSVSSFNTSTKKDISIGGRENVRIMSMSSTTCTSGNFTLTVDRNPGVAGNQGLLYSYTTDTPVYVVKYITYTVNASLDPPAITRDEHLGSGAQQIAQNISSMSVSQSGNLVTLTLNGRTKKVDRTTGQYATSQATNDIYLRNQ